MIYITPNFATTNNEFTLSVHLTEDYTHCPTFLHYQQALLNKEKLALGIIQKTWPSVPYLTTKEALLLNISKKQVKAHLEEYQQLLHLSSTSLTKKRTALSTKEKILLQLLHMLLANKEEVIIEDFFTELSITDIQELLPLFKQLNQEYQMNILLFTSNDLLAKSPYVDTSVTD
ncbi:MAG: hypothetical protein ACK5NA_01985 [Enterococcus sp.]